MRQTDTWHDILHCLVLGQNKWRYKISMLCVIILSKPSNKPSIALYFQRGNGEWGMGYGNGCWDAGRVSGIPEDVQSD